MKKINLTIWLIAFYLLSYSQKMTVGYIFPAGGQAGTSFIIEAGGLNINQATAVYISGKGVKAEIIRDTIISKKNTRRKFDDQSSPQLAEKVKIRINIDKNTAPGLRDLRLQASKSISNKLIFEVGQYPDFIEKDISTKQKPNQVKALPATLCGQILPGECDYYAFEAKKGTRFVAAVKARTFVPYIADAVPGWFQAVISLRNSRGKEISYNDDFRNNPDPVIICEIPEDDTYTLMIHDAIFRGREDFNYRIDVGEIPFIKSIYPPVGNKGKRSQVHIDGINIDKNTFNFKPGFEGKGTFTVQNQQGFTSNPVPYLSFHPSKKIIDYNSQEPLKINSIIFDSLTTSNKIRQYTLDLNKNETLVAVITARKINSMLDARLSLYDVFGKKLITVDDTEDPMEGLMTHHADPVLKFKAPSTGKYLLLVEDVLQGSGTDFYYILERKPASNDYEIFVSPANISIPKGGTTSFMLDVVTPDKKAPALDIEVQGLPSGFVVSNTEIRGTKWEVSVTAPEKAKTQAISLKVLATEKLRKRDKGNEMNIETTEAVAADNMMQAFYYTHHIPAFNFVAEVTEEAPFSLHFESQIEKNLTEPIIIQASDTLLPLKIILKRKSGFNETVSLQLNRKNKFISLDPIEFKSGETEKIIPVKLNLKDMPGRFGIRHQLSIVGTVNGQTDKKGKRTFENAQYREMTPVVILELK